MSFLSSATVKPTVSKVWQSAPEGDYASAGQPRDEARVEDIFGNSCDFNKQIDTFLIANHRMYIFL